MLVLKKKTIISNWNIKKNHSGLETLKDTTGIILLKFKYNSTRREDQKVIGTLIDAITLKKD